MSDNRVLELEGKARSLIQAAEANLEYGAECEHEDRSLTIFLLKKANTQALVAARVLAALILGERSHPDILEDCIRTANELIEQNPLETE